MPNLTDAKITSRIQPEVAQCPLPTILLKLKDTLADFYERTKLDRVDYSVDTLANIATVTLPIPAGKILVQAHEVRINKIQLIERSEDSLDLDWSELRNGFNFTSGVNNNFGGLDDPTWRTATSTQPRAYYFEPNGDLRLVAIPETAFAGEFALKTRVSLKPDSDLITSIDDVHWRDYKDVIVAGTFARLMVMSKKSWTDLTMARFWSEQYEADVTEAAARIGRSEIRNDRQVYHAKAYP